MIPDKTMKPNRRSALIYGLLLGLWVLVVGWQVDEHFRWQEGAKTGLRNRSHEIANTLSAVMRATSFQGGVVQRRLQPVLDELVNGSTNQLVKSSELISVALLNTNNVIVVSAGAPVDITNADVLENGEHWAADKVTFIIPIRGESNTASMLIPLPRNPTNFFAGAGIDFPRREPPPGEDRPQPPGEFNPTNGPNGPGTNDNPWLASNMPPGGPPGGPLGGPRGPRGPRDGGGRPPWLRVMDDQRFELRGLVLAMPTRTYLSNSEQDLWMRYIIVFFSGVIALGAGLNWRYVSKISELQIRLIRASELNSHLREMNLAAAGLAHETRNPLNIIRGMAQMLSKQPDLTPGVQEKSQAIVNQTDRVTAQLNEFINYSRPREVRRVRLSLASAINEVVRTLGFDIQEKKLTLESSGDPLFIEADEQLLRQVLFNLLLNAAQAAGMNGHIQIVTRKAGPAGGVLEIRDDGPGVPPENRQEIFKPYFTTNQKGTGLGLAVVQQIVLAHGWEIVCLPNEPKGALFRISHLKLRA